MQPVRSYHLGSYKSHPPHEHHVHAPGLILMTMALRTSLYSAKVAYQCLVLLTYT